MSVERMWTKLRNSSPAPIRSVSESAISPTTSPSRRRLRHPPADARQYGYQDGYNDGLRDRQTGHSFRPTHDDNYRDANRGWDSRMVSSNDYKYAYRQAYSNGYE